VECVAILTGIVYAVAGPESVAAAQSISYGVCAVAVFAGMSTFLSSRGVPAKQIWYWRRKDASEDESRSAQGPLAYARGSEQSRDRQGADAQSLLTPRLLRRWCAGSARGVGWLLMGAGAGLALGLFAHLYLIVLQYIPAAAEAIHKSQQEMARMPNLRVWSAIMAVGFAPFAEEYLFRGLVFRALDREWGGWRAVAGGAAFFAIYHAPLAWLPVGVLGAVNCLLFKRSRRLAPAVVLHMIYNAVVLG
jgi:Type II CAAX prenyl endopeptidase Rce1-like